MHETSRGHPCSRLRLKQGAWAVAWRPINPYTDIDFVLVEQQTLDSFGAFYAYLDLEIDFKGIGLLIYNFLGCWLWCFQVQFWCGVGSLKCMI